MNLPLPRQSFLDMMGQLPHDEREAAMLRAARALDPDEASTAGMDHEELVAFAWQKLRSTWRFVARREQLPPEGEWAIWLIQTGRGWGKTLSAANWIIEKHKAGCTLSGILARTHEDLMRYCIRGPSGILSVANDSFKPFTRGESLRWPGVGQAPYPNAESLFFYSKNPDSIRGPNLQAAWCDELAGWLSPTECWNNLRFTMRDGENPQIVVTTTPQPIKVIRDLAERARTDQMVRITFGSTYDNRQNLAASFIEEMRTQYEGTRLGRQELHGELLMQAEGALWDWEYFDRAGFRLDEPPCELVRIGVGVDPAATSTEDSSETGIIKGGRGEDGRGYVLADHSGRYSPSGWARKAIFSYFGTDDGVPADAIIAERNNGGDMVKHTIDVEARELKRNGEIPTEHIPVRVVWASRGKAARAEPVATRYEQGRVSHCGLFQDLEYQLTSWEPQGGMRSPDRLDALVWALHWALDVGKPAEWEPGDGVGTVGTLASAGYTGLYDEIDRLREEYPL